MMLGDMKISTWLIVFTSLSMASYGCLSYPDQTISPGRQMMARVVDAIWEDRDQVLGSALDNLLLDELDIQGLTMDDVTSEEDQAVSCQQCRVFVGGIKGFINRGLIFEDIREFAISACYNVTETLLDWDGDIICEGIVDVFGPHIFYIANNTDMDTEDICIFQRACSGGQNSDPDITRLRRRPPVARNPVSSERKGIERQSKEDMTRIAHITDVHLDPKYSPGSPSDCRLPICCRDYWPGKGSAGDWGNHGCHLPVQTMDLILGFYKELGVQTIINTGDNCNSALWEETLDSQLLQTELLADSIRTNLPGVQTHITLGNHETYPTNLFYGPSPVIQELLHEIRLMYQDLTNFTDYQTQTFEDAGYYVMEVLPGLKVLSYNSNYGFTDNFYGILLQDTPDWSNQDEFLEREFNLARDNGEKILLISHHPMGGGFTFYDDYINDVIGRHADVIMLHLFGHFHSDQYKMSLDAEGNAVHVNIVGAAMVSYGNPTFRVIYLDSETLVPMEYDNYFINISRSMTGEDPVIELMYNTYTDYNMEDLTAPSYQNFTDRMEVNEELFDLFRWNEVSRGHRPGPCDENCRQAFFCSRRTTYRPDYNACRSAYEH